MEFTEQVQLQFIAVKDIGKIVAGIFADPAKFGSRTIEIAGDTVTGTELTEKFSRTAERPITYHTKSGLTTPFIKPDNLPWGDR